MNNANENATDPTAETLLARIGTMIEHQVNRVLLEKGVTGPATAQQPATSARNAGPARKPLGLKFQVASIFPFERDYPVPRYLHGKTYKLPAVHKDEPPALIEITDWEERMYAGMGRDTAKMIPAIDTAEGFVNHATNFIMGRRNGGQPGIWIVGTLENGQLTLEQETEIMRDRQRRFFQDWVDDAREHAAQHEFSLITPMHRVAGSYLDLNPESETWMVREYDAKMVACRYCRKSVDKTAVKCPHCAGIINPERYAQMRAEEEQIIQSYGKPGRKIREEVSA